MLGTPQGTCLVTIEATHYASKSIAVICIDDYILRTPKKWPKFAYKVFKADTSTPS